MIKLFKLDKAYIFFSKKIKILNRKIFTSKIGYYYFNLRGVFKAFNTLTSDIEGSKKVLIIGKGASIKRISGEKLSNLIEKCDYRILASSVDISNHPTLKKYTYNVQFTSRVDDLNGFCPVYPQEILNNFSIRALCINSNKKYNNGLSLARYKRFFNYPNIKLLDVGFKEGFTPISDEPSLYGGRSLTMLHNILKQIMDCSSVKEIILLGVDFYGTGYLDETRTKSKKEQKTFYDIKISNDNPRENEGIPCLKYIMKLTQSKFFKNRFKLIIPKEIEAYIPDKILKVLRKTNSVLFV